MPEPPPRRRPATELEVKLARGDPSAQDALIDLLDTVLHRDLEVLYSPELPDDERSRIVVGVIADFVQRRVQYDCSQASIETLAKRRARQRAIDYFRHRGVAERARPNLKRREDLLRAVQDPSQIAANLEQVAARQRLIKRLMIEIELLPENLRRAALAYMRHGDSDPKYGGKAYSTILAEELNVDPGLVAQWWCRARRRLQKALAAESGPGEKRRMG